MAQVITKETPVIFRKWQKEGDVIALFPTIPATNDWRNECQSYQTIGQHGAASVHLVDDTVPATPKDYKDLLKELHGRGYRKLRIYHRMQYNRWSLARLDALKAMV